MNEWILFTIGIMIGSMGGVMTIALLSAGKVEDLYSEIRDLRFQRKALKDELNKRLSKSKPKPRKKRNYKPRTNPKNKKK